MAKILLGATIGDARNKAGAIVYSKNRFGAYLRQKVSPVQPRSTAQLNVRSNFTSITKSWQTISATNQAGWTSLASANPVRDKFGNSQILTGAQFYMKVNRILANAGLTQLTAPPADQAVDAPTSSTLTATSGGTPVLSLVIAPTPNTADAVIVRATPGLSKGRSFVQNALKQVIVKAPPVSSPVNLLTAWQALFGTLQAGQKIYTEVHYVGINGAASSPNQTFAIST
ncbi:MAG: hypothetical protein ACRD59_13880 [Candidatus Acidiferrales bacterium]